MMPVPAEFTFDQYEVGTGTAKHQTVLTGFFLGGAIAEIAVASVDENSARYLRIYAFNDDIWEQRLNVPLRPEVLFIDVTNIGGRDRLITYDQDSLNWFDPDAAVEHTLVEVTTNYNAPDEAGIFHVDITHDVNGDARDDLIMPDIDGFWIATQFEERLVHRSDKTWTA